MVTLAVQADGQGQLSGTQICQSGLRDFGVGQLTVRLQPTCLHVDGNSAWVGAVVTDTTAPDLLPIGFEGVVLMRDLGGPGEDIMHAEPMPPGLTCHDMPSLPETQVFRGDFRVQ